jgi:Acyl-CoA dehydrogenase, C-terminal domain
LKRAHVLAGADLELFTGGVQKATESQSGDGLDAALADLGWVDALEQDRRAAVSVLFECQGSAHATSSALDRVLLGALGLAADPTLAVCLPPLRETGPPAVLLTGGRCTVRGVAYQSMARCGRAVVVAAVEGGYRALSVPPDALELRAVEGIDPALGLLAVRGDIDLALAELLGDAAWVEAVALGQLALAHEPVGGARAMLELARQHALDRVQFGRPISAFQAVRHRLADAFVAAEAAAALLDEAWQEPTAYGAMGKAFAGRAARLVAKQAQQVLAGIGFTAEHPFHHYVRRVLILDQLLGAGSLLTRRLGAAVLRSGDLPREFPL